MQGQLIQAYSKFKEKSVLPDILQERLSPPLLLKVSEAWENSKKRVLVVGQETLGWGFHEGEYYQWPYASILSFKDFVTTDNSVEAMIRGYSSFEFAKHQPDNYRSPFWNAYRQVRKANGDEIDGINTTVLWSNLFRMSLDGGSVIKNGTSEEVSDIRTASAGLLLSEMEILKPTSAIFFTGPDYNDALYSEFDHSRLIRFKDYDTSRTSYISHPILPKRAIRTYHPGYLNRGHWEIVNEIIEAVIE